MGCVRCKASGKRLAYEVLKGYTKLVEKPLYALPKASPIDDSFLLKFSADDSGNALAVNELYGEHLLYTDAYGWLVWNDTHWKADQDRVTHFIVDTLVRRRVAAVEAGKEKVVEASRANKYRLDGCLPFLKIAGKRAGREFRQQSRRVKRVERCAKPTKRNHHTTRLHTTLYLLLTRSIQSRCRLK